MVNIKAGDKVRVKSRADWPSPPGYRLAQAEGEVIDWIELEELMAEFQDYAYVKIEKAQDEAKAYIGKTMFFRVENLDKI